MVVCTIGQVWLEKSLDSPHEKCLKYIQKNPFAVTYPSQNLEVIFVITDLEDVAGVVVGTGEDQQGVRNIPLV